MLTALAILAFRKQNIHILLYVLFAAVYGLVRPIVLYTEYNTFFAYLNPSINQPDIGAVFKSQAFIFIFETFLLLGAILAGEKSRQSILKIKRIPVPSFPLLVSSVTFFAPIVLPSLSMFSLATLAYLSSVSIRRNNFSVWCVGSFFWIFLILVWLFLYSEDRRDWLIVILLLFFYTKSIFNARVVLVRIAVGMLGVAAMGYVAIAFRTDGLLDYRAVIYRLATSSEAVIGIIEVETDFSIVYDDYTILFDESFQKIEYLYGLSFLKPIVAVIPRDVWSGKPETSSRLFSKFYNPGFYNAGGSEPITVWGDFFWNFSWFGAILGFFVGWAMRGGDRLFEMNFPLKLSTFLFTFHLLRGPFDNFWVIIAFLFVLDLFAKAILPRDYFSSPGLSNGRRSIGADLRV